MNRMIERVGATLLALLAVVVICPRTLRAEPPAGAQWELVFQDEFDGTTADLAKTWDFQNGKNSHILCSRWRENVVAENGLCRLLNKKESRGGQDWTSGSMWTRRAFKYGYFECRYKYGAATGLNNSFWIMTQGKERPEVPVRFEIDINEGHYPNQVCTNIHRWSGKHIGFSRCFRLGEGQPKTCFPLEKPLETDKLRLVIDEPGRVRVSELRIYPWSAQGGYPPLPGEKGPATGSAMPNLALGAKATASSTLEDYTADKAIDGKLEMASRWVSADHAAGPHTLTVELDRKHPVGCLQVISGTKKGDAFLDPIRSFVLQYWDGQRWVEFANSGTGKTQVNLAREFHVYGLDWTAEELVYYFDGKELRRWKNEFCHGEAPVWLSSAIMTWAGPVTDAIDGTSMDVDYVRVYRRKP